MRKYLPGPYTFILKASSKVPKILESKRNTVGIRVPNNNIARVIVHRLGHPIVSTSIKKVDE
jgi:tRNA A37 threonylcarbamoyladenosine synthetase subunit TsaC/SUA5/YrdC